MATALAKGAIVGGRYRLERVLGEGGMGVVWAATELAGGATRAVKLLKAVGDDLGAEDDAEARKRFRHEAKSAAAVRHAHVVEILEVLELDDGRPALVMELLEGETLRQVLARRGKLPLAEMMAVALPVISAVAAAHALGVVHRDLKPENLFLTGGGRGEGGGRGGVVKILDFGIAKVTALDGETMRTTGLTTGKVLGTPAYMAPEQVYGQTDLDHRVDIWALGLFFYQALSGVLPTAGDNIGQVFRNVTARPFPPLSELEPGLPAPLCALVMRMLARERAERPADLSEVLAALAEATGDEAQRWPRLPAPAAPLREQVRREQAGRAAASDTLPAARAEDAGEASAIRTAVAPGAAPLVTAISDASDRTRSCRSLSSSSPPPPRPWTALRRSASPTRPRATSRAMAGRATCASCAT